MARWSKRFRFAATDLPITTEIVQVVFQGEALGHASQVTLTDGGYGWRFNNTIPDGTYDIYIQSVLQDGSGGTLPISPQDIIDIAALQGATVSQRPDTTYAGTEPSVGEMLVHLTSVSRWAYFNKVGEQTFLVSRVSVAGGDATDFKLVTLN